MSRLDLKCITELLPNILEKSSDEDIENLEKIIQTYRYKNCEKSWLKYFENKPEFQIRERYKEENRIKDPKTILKGSTIEVTGNENFYNDHAKHRYELYHFKFKELNKYVCRMSSSDESYIIDVRHPEYCIRSYVEYDKIYVELVKSKLYFYVV